MGNQLNAQTVKQNLPKYKPNLSSYQLISQQPHPLNHQDNTILVWQHKTSLQRLIQKKYFVRTWLQFHQLLDMFALRYNDPFIVSAQYLDVQSSVIDNLDTSCVFPQTYLSIFYEQTLTNLSCFDDIPQEDGAYFLLQSLKGFQKLAQKTKLLFQVKQEMFHITHSRKLKIWFSDSIWQSNTIDSVRPLSTESQMVYQVLSIIQENISFCTQSQKNLSLKNHSHIQPIVIEELINKAPQSFQQAIELALKHLESDEVQQNNQMTCLKNLTQDQIMKIFELTKNKIKIDHPGNHTLNSYNQFYPSQQIHQFSSQSYPNNINFPEITTQFHNKSLANNFQRQQRQFKNGHSMRVSRDKSNKKSGLSLVKNSQEQTEIRKNHHSLLIIKPGLTSCLNQHSTVTLQKTNGRMPPKAGIVNFNFKTIDQNQSQVNPFVANKNPLVKRGNSLLNGQHSKGITITRRSNSAKKDNKLVIGTNFDSMRDNVKADKMYQNSRVMLRLNNERKNHNQHQESSIMIGSFPHPIYSNNSIVTSNNFHQVIPNQTFSSNMSFDPLLPNQSLTRFHKEFVTTSNVNSSQQQFYEIPKIYVHSPKVKHKIFNFGSVETQQPGPSHSPDERIKKINSKMKLERHTNKQFVSDSVQQSQSQNTVSKNDRLNEYQSYIHQNQSVFTHPVLYQYITNKNKSQISHNERPASAKTYIDYLSNVKISQSLDYNTAQKIFQNHAQHAQNQQNHTKKDSPSCPYSINDFPTIQQIEENPNDEFNDKQNLSFVPIHINLSPQPNAAYYPPSVRRGYEESVVVEYKKFYDDTNRSNNSPNKHYFSPLKKNNVVANRVEELGTNQDRKQYATTNNWQRSPSKLLVQRPSSVHQVVYQVNQLNQVHEQRNHSPSPMSKIIYRGQKPSINPLLMQDLQKIRQKRIY